jgi:hypothetical protein
LRLVWEKAMWCTGIYLEMDGHHSNTHCNYLEPTVWSFDSRCHLTVMCITKTKLHRTLTCCTKFFINLFLMRNQCRACVRILFHHIYHSMLVCLVWIGKSVEWSGYGVFWVTVTIFAVRTGADTRNVRITCLWAKCWTRELPDIQDCYPLDWHLVAFQMEVA